MVYNICVQCTYIYILCIWKTVWNSGDMDVFLTFYHWIATWRFEDLDLLASELAQRSKLYWRLKATWKSVILSLPWVGSWICKFWRAEEAFVICFCSCFIASEHGKQVSRQVRFGLVEPVTMSIKLGRALRRAGGLSIMLVKDEVSGTTLPKFNSSPGWKVTNYPRKEIKVVFKVSFFGGVCC